MDNNNLSWLIVGGVIVLGGMAFLSYRGITSFFPDISLGGDKRKPDASTQAITEAQLSTAGLHSYAETYYPENQELKDSITNFEKELKEYRDSMIAYNSATRSEKTRGGSAYEAMWKEYADVIDAATIMTRLSGGNIVVEVAQQ